MHFQKEDLLEHHYWWTDKSSGRIFDGQPSRRLFDRFHGDQVLFLINFYGSCSDQFTRHIGRRIEYEICHHLPLESKSEISVFNWIQNMFL